MIDLTGKNLILFDYINISSEWFSAIATLLAVIVALSLAVYANFKDYILDKKLKYLIFQILAFEMNSISHKTVTLIKWIEIHQFYICKGVVPRSFLIDFLDEMQLLIRYMRMSRIHENIDKYLRIPRKDISRHIVSHVKLYEHQSSRLDILFQKIQISLNAKNSDEVEINKETFESIQKILEKSFEGVMLGFNLLNMKSNIIKLDEEVMKGLKISFPK